MEVRQLGVQTPAGHEHTVRPLLDDAAIAENDDSIGPPYRGQTVSDDNGGSTDHEIFERFNNESLGLCVEG